MDGLLQSVRLHEEVQLVVLSRLQREVLGGEPDQAIAHLLLHQQHLGVGAAAQRLLGEVTGASDALLALQQGVQLGLEYLKMAHRDKNADKGCRKTFEMTHIHGKTSTYETPLFFNGSKQQYISYMRAEIGKKEPHSMQQVTFKRFKK